MLLIYLPKISARCNYIFDYIFQTELGIEYAVTTDITEFRHYQQEKINYSFSRIDDGFFVKASSLLFENKIARQEIIVEEKNGMKVWKQCMVVLPKNRWWPAIILLVV